MQKNYWQLAGPKWITILSKITLPQAVVYAMWSTLYLFYVASNGRRIKDPVTIGGNQLTASQEAIIVFLWFLISSQLVTELPRKCMWIQCLISGVCMVYTKPKKYPKKIPSLKFFRYLFNQIWLGYQSSWASLSFYLGSASLTWSSVNSLPPVWTHTASRFLLHS